MLMTQLLLMCVAEYLFIKSLLIPPAYVLKIEITRENRQLFCT